MALASLVAISGPKKVSIYRATPSNAPRNDVASLKTITYRAISTTGTLIVNILQSVMIDLPLLINLQQIYQF
jgi:hypothetical protein